MFAHRKEEMKRKHRHTVAVMFNRHQVQVLQMVAQMYVKSKLMNAYAIWQRWAYKDKVLSHLMYAR